MSDKPLSGLRILVTAGPTAEPLDPVRVITNRSSGRQGYAIAEALRDAGADVLLISGPVTLPAPPGITLHRVERAQEMLDACCAALPVDVAICAAAVADWQLPDVPNQKMKKSAEDTLTLTFIKTPDILAHLAAPGPQRPRLVLGFAAETGDLLDKARSKLKRKGCDGLLANDVSGGAVFGAEDNHIWLVTPSGETDLGHGSKADLAARLIPVIAAYFTQYQQQKETPHVT